MAKKTLKFTATAWWARQEAIEMVKKETMAVATEKLAGPPNSGSLTILAKEPGEVNKAVDLIMRDPILGKLFEK